MSKDENNDPIIIKQITELDPSKIYILQVPSHIMEEAGRVIKQLEGLKETHGIRIIVMDESLKFVNIPKGYKIEKTNE